MPAHPKQFLEFAEKLLNEANSDDSHHRAAAHAAYYAVYHLVVQYYSLDTEKREAPHGVIISKLRCESGAPPYISQAKTVYTNLIDIREHADYFLNKEFPPEDAEDAVEYAKGVFRKLTT